MREKRLITKTVEKKLTELIIDFAAREGMTIENVNGAVRKAKKYMKNNAIMQYEEPIPDNRSCTSATERSGYGIQRVCKEKSAGRV